MQAVGVDVARGGWIAVVLEDGRFVDGALERSFAAVLERFPRAAIIGVDAPIGLPPVGERRRADVAARTMIGPRRSSVFFAPSHVALLQPTYAAAREVAPGTSAQAWAIGRAILEVERSRDGRLREVHPEVSFAALAAAPLAFAKRTWNGQWERLRLLRSVGIDLPERLDAGLAAVDDVLDAAIVAWSAMRVARGESETLPPDPRPGEPVIHY